MCPATTSLSVSPYMTYWGLKNCIGKHLSNICHNLIRFHVLYNLFSVPASEMFIGFQYKICGCFCFFLQSPSHVEVKILCGNISAADFTLFNAQGEICSEICMKHKYGFSVEKSSTFFYLPNICGMFWKCTIPSIRLSLVTVPDAKDP